MTKGATASARARASLKKQFTKQEVSVSIIAMEESIEGMRKSLNDLINNFPSMMRDGVKASLEDGGGTIVRRIVVEETGGVGKKIRWLQKWSPIILAFGFVAEQVPGFSWEALLLAIGKALLKASVGA